MTLLTASWIPKTKRRDHAERKRMRESPARVKWCCGARRSGKTTDGLDYILVGHGPKLRNGMRKWRGAFNPPADIEEPCYVIAAPTREMVKRIWWSRLKARIPWEFILRVNETDLFVDLVNGARVQCLGMDRPTRSEGFAIDGMVGDEFAYWKAKAFEQSLRPALGTVGRPKGWAILMGKPQGRNHFFESWTKAKEGRRPNQDAFHWKSAVLISEEELAEARASMDARSYEQEYEASFLTLTGAVYCEFDANKHARNVVYDPGLPLVFCFDFNVKPGAAVVVQEQTLPPWDDVNGTPQVTTCVVDEVHIEDDSTTPRVCAKLAEKYPAHKREVFVYGDPSGNQRRTSATSTDWDQVRDYLGQKFHDVRMRVGLAAPSVIDSVNSVNTRLSKADGMVRFAINGALAEETKKDLEGVVWDPEKTEREMFKDDMLRTHWSDALRYYIHEKHPLGGAKLAVY